MKKRTCYWMVIILSIPLLEACGQSDPDAGGHETYIHGRLTVDSELDSTGDNSGIQLLMLTGNPVTGQVDTVYSAETNRDGDFSGTAQFPRRSLYTMTISRYGNPLADVRVILAEGDTVRLEGVLPQIDETAVIESVENSEITNYNRLERGINRILGLAEAGVVSQDTLSMELARWSDLMWDYYGENSRYYAGERAAITSVRLLEGVNDSLMIDRIHMMVDSSSVFIPVASHLGVQYHIWYNDLETAIAFMDSLASREMDRRTRMELQMNRIDLLNNNAQVEQAQEVFATFREEFSDEFAQVRLWADRIEVDLTRLASGSPMPDFSFETMSGQTLSRESMTGTPYVIEFSTLDNTLYQDQFDQSAAIFHIYNNFGVQFISVPLSATEVTAEAYFEEMPEGWHVALPGSFDEQELVQRFNTHTLPTRIVVSPEGTIARKYEGAELDQIVSGFRTVLNSSGESQ